VENAIFPRPQISYVGPFNQGRGRRNS